MESKDRPTQLVVKKRSNLGKRVGLMIQMCEPILVTGKSIVLESEFCVAKGIMALEESVVYDGALIKKHIYWPKGVSCDGIKHNLHNRYLSDVDMLEAMKEEGPEGKLFSIF